MTFSNHFWIKTVAFIVLIYDCAPFFWFKTTLKRAETLRVKSAVYDRSEERPQVTVIYDKNHINHRVYYDHSEQPERATAAENLLRSVDGVSFVSPRAGGDDAAVSFDAREKALRALLRVHQDWYVDDIKEMSRRGGGKIDFDTYAIDYYVRRYLFDQTSRVERYATRDTYDVCLNAALAWLDGCDVASTGKLAFALTRPPGHHATSCQAMGFCFFNFAAATAKYALDELGLERVAILDFDVHYGNGVAAIVRSDPRIRYCSLHETGSFPGTGFEEMAGGPNKNIRCLEIDPSDGRWDGRYGSRFRVEAVPWLEEFNPDLLIVCAGYDALEADPLANFSLQPKNYYEMSCILKEAFGRKILFGLEGGYAVNETAHAILATLEPFL